MFSKGKPIVPRANRAPDAIPSPRGVGRQYAEQNHVRISLTVAAASLLKRLSDKKPIPLSEGMSVRDGIDIKIEAYEIVWGLRQRDDTEHTARRNKGAVFSSLNGLTDSQIKKYWPIGMAWNASRIGINTYQRSTAESIGVVFEGSVPAKSFEHAMYPGCPVMIQPIETAKLGDDAFSVLNGKRVGIFVPYTKFPFMVLMDKVVTMIDQGKITSLKPNPISDEDHLANAILRVKSDPSGENLRKLCSAIHQIDFGNLTSFRGNALTPCNPRTNPCFQLDLRPGI